MIAPASQHLLDWFHVTMRITVLRQFAQQLESPDVEAGLEMPDALKRIRWHPRHGNTHRAREDIGDSNAVHYLLVSIIFSKLWLVCLLFIRKFG